MPLSRRQFLQRSFWAGAAAITPSSLWAANERPLPIPPLLNLRRGQPLYLNFSPARMRFNDNQPVETWGVNGNYLAPTVQVKADSSLKLMLANQLSEPIAFQLHGILSNTAVLGSSHKLLAPNSTYTPTLWIQQTACTAWYRADRLLNSAPQLYQGGIGLWLVEDANSSQNTLPNRYGINDIPLILQDMTLDKNGQPLRYFGDSSFYGSRLFVNGVENGYVKVPRGWVRLRVLNASVSRIYELQLDSGEPLYLIGGGMGMLAEPLPMTQIRLVPNERVELLVDMNEAARATLITGEKRGGVMERVQSWFADSERLQSNVVVSLRADGDFAVLKTQPRLPPFNADQFHLAIQQERRFALQVAEKTINRQRFDPARIDFNVKLGSVERWYLTADQAVGFTLQGAKFIVETRGGKREPLNRLMWQDTCWLAAEQETTILVRFDQPTAANLPFNFGVSDFALRDRGAMGQFAVGN